MTYHIIHLYTSLDLFINRLHIGSLPHSLKVHTLKSKWKCIITESFLQLDHLHNLLTWWVLKLGLCLTRDTVRKIKVTNCHTRLVRFVPKNTRLNIVVWLTRITTWVVYRTCDFKINTFWVWKCPLSLQLELISKWHPQLDVDAINEVMGFERLQVHHNFFEWVRFSKKITSSNKTYKDAWPLFIMSSIISC